MEDSILISVKLMVGVGENDNSFDLDILTYINSAFSTLTQIGVGPVNGFVVDSKDVKWSEYGVPQHHLSLIRSYIPLKVRLSFDPPGTGFHKDALQKEIDEMFGRLSLFREVEKDG